MESNCITSGKIRTIYIQESVFMSMSDDELMKLQQFMGLTLISKYKWVEKVFKIRVYNPSFDVIIEGNQIPIYNVVVTHKDGDIQFEWKKYDM